MYRSPLKLMIQDGKRLNISNAIVKYRYITNGERADDDIASICFFGVNDNGSNCIGRFNFVTDENYVSNKYLSIVAGGFIPNDYNYIYYIIDTVDGFYLDGIKINTTISDLSIKDDN